MVVTLSSSFAPLSRRELNFTAKLYSFAEEVGGRG
jgi:hypothetical protein